MKEMRMLSCAAELEYREGEEYGEHIYDYGEGITVAFLIPWGQSLVIP